jgi:DNA repair protein RadC
MSAGQKNNDANATIREWIREERPREALHAFGAESISIAKLFAIIIRTGTKGSSAEELSRKLLNRFATLRGMDSAPMSEILEIPGIGPAKAAQIKAALEIGKRFSRESACVLHPLSTPRRVKEYVAAYFGPHLRDAGDEITCLILLDRKNRPMRALQLAKGTPDAVAVEPGQIVREALKVTAASVVLVHNHPSGDPEPSDNDVSLTCAIRDACALCGVRLLDHVVIGRNPEDYRSFVEEGLL